MAERESYYSDLSTINPTGMGDENETGVNAVHPQLKEIMPQYTMIEDCVAGELKVKQKGSVYLPRPKMGTKRTTSADEIYNAYKMRAQFGNYTQSTLDALVGLAFVRDAIIEIPKELEFLLENANGGGLGLLQLAKEMLMYVFGYGRAALLVEFPMEEKEGVPSQPTITLVPPKKLINWIGSPTVNTVVVEQDYEVLDGFAVSSAMQYKVFQLKDNGVQYGLHQENEDGDLEEINSGGIVLANGQALQQLPLFLAGSENNDYRVDKPPMYRLASTELSLYRSSAEYEDISFQTQPTYFMTIPDKKFVQQMYPDGIKVGAHNVLVMQPGGAAGILQANPSQAPQLLMDMKKKDISQMGGDRLDALNIDKTAFEVAVDQTTRNASLNSAAKNVSTALTDAINLAGQFVRMNSQKPAVFELDVSAGTMTMAPQTLAALTQLASGGFMNRSEIREHLAKDGWIREEDIDATDDMTATPFADDEVTPQEQVQTVNDETDDMVEGNG